MNKEASVQKPITMLRSEFINNLLNLINNSQLPYFVIEYILNDILKEVHVACNTQAEMDKTYYENTLKSVGQDSKEEN